MIFNHKLSSCDFERKVASFKRVIWTKKSAEAEAELAKNTDGNEKSPVDTKKTKDISFDFIIGCDGVHSVLRENMMKQIDMDFQQIYIDALWCDFFIPPAFNGNYRMDPSYLHLWPDKESIIIAQPDIVSLDRSRKL